MLTPEVVLGCPNFLPRAILGAIPKKNRRSEPSAQEKTLPEMNRKAFSRFSSMRALSSPRLGQPYCRHEDPAKNRQITSTIENFWPVSEIFEKRAARVEEDACHFAGFFCFYSLVKTGNAVSNGEHQLGVS